MFRRIQEKCDPAHLDRWWEKEAGFSQLDQSIKIHNIDEEIKIIFPRIVRSGVPGAERYV